MPSARGNTSDNEAGALDAWRERAIESRFRYHLMLEAEYTTIQRVATDRNIIAQRLEAWIKRLDDITEAERRILSDIGRSAWTDRIQSEEWQRTTGWDGARITQRISRLADATNVVEGQIRCTHDKIKEIEQMIVDINALLTNE
jgi:hypothetical protein